MAGMFFYSAAESLCAGCGESLCHSRVLVSAPGGAYHGACYDRMHRTHEVGEVMELAVA